LDKRVKWEVPAKNGFAVAEPARRLRLALVRVAKQFLSAGVVANKAFDEARDHTKAVGFKKLGEIGVLALISPASFAASGKAFKKVYPVAVWSNRPRFRVEDVLVLAFQNG
jgi:hypothetical protein